MAQIPFTVSARTARLIGRENVANAEGAIIELVKNCFDADADFAMVLVNPVKKSIIIYDNGTGMSEKDIKGNWMNIGTDNKENNFKSDKGRIKAGAKGIGRFALDRLGEKCTMHTLETSKKDGFKWSTNWNDFEKTGTVIGNVFAELVEENNTNLLEILKKETSNPRVLKAIEKHKAKKGTLLKIEIARDDWNEELSNKVFQSLEILTPPEGQHKFDVFFFNESHKSQYGKIENEEFHDYDYKVVATYKKNADRELKIQIHRNEFDFNLIDKEVFNREQMQEFPFDKKTFKKEKFTLDSDFYELLEGFREKEKNNLTDTIGDFTFVLYFFKLGSSAKNDAIFKYKSFNTPIRRRWADKFSGIKLFRDNFRVRPYGEIGTASYDWLMLGERQGKNPAGASRDDFQIKPYQVAGTISFSRVSKLFLDDKSDREGLIENDTFLLFKNLLLEIISKLESDRSTIAYNLKSYADELDIDSKVEEEAIEIAEGNEKDETPEVTKKQNKTLKNAIRSQKKKIELKDEELVLSRAMASAGILIASFSHEFHSIKNKLNSRTTNLKNALLPVLPETKLKGIEPRKNPYHLINQFKELDDKVKQWIEFSIMLTRKDRRRSKKINLLEYFDELKINWKRKLQDRGVALTISSSSKNPKDYSVKMIELDLDTIFDNLITNSIEAFQRNGFKGNRMININLNKVGAEIELEYRDSGPGISKDIKKHEDIFKPFVTTKRDNLGKEIGTGLGMWLLKSSIDYNKGSVKLYNPDSGFQIRMFLNSTN